MAEPQLLPAQLRCLGTHFKHFGIPRSLGNLKSITTAQKIKISHHISWNSMILLVCVDFHPFTCKSEIHGEVIEWSCRKYCHKRNGKRTVTRIGIAMRAFGYAGCGDKRGCSVFCLVLVLPVGEPTPNSQINQSRKWILKFTIHTIIHREQLVSARSIVQYVATYFFENMIILHWTRCSI